MGGFCKYLAEVNEITVMYKKNPTNNPHKQPFRLEDRVFVYFYVYFYTAWGNLITKSLSSVLGVKFSSTILKQNYSFGHFKCLFFISLKTIITNKTCV